MHVISRKRLNEFAQIHPNAKSALVHWYKLVKQKDFSSFFSLTPSLWEGWGGPGVLASSQEIRAASMAARRFGLGMTSSSLQKQRAAIEAAR